jgi:hypothetical protein
MLVREGRDGPHEILGARYFAALGLDHCALGQSEPIRAVSAHTKATPKNKRLDFAVIGSEAKPSRGPETRPFRLCLNYAEAAGNGGVAAPGWLRRKSSSQ